MGRKRHARKLCAFCGAPAVGRDHIPPESFFPDDPAYRNQLITVPACKKCNTDESAHDQYLNFIIASYFRVGTNPISGTLHPRVLSGLAEDHPATKKFRDGVRNIGPGLGYSMVNQDDVERVMGRVVRGLYWKHFKQRVPNHMTVVCASITSLVGTTPPTLADFAYFKAAIDEVNAPLYDIGPGVFKYRYRAEPTSPYRSSWHMSLYDAIEFISVIYQR